MQGPAVSGSPDVIVNGKPALRVGDMGIHSACCGANTWQSIAGSATVFINGLPAHRMGDAVRHCGGMGQLIEGSPDVFVGDQGPSGAAQKPATAPANASLFAAPAAQAQTLVSAAEQGTPFCEICAAEEKQ